MWAAREKIGLLRLYTKLPYRYSGCVWRIPDDGDCVTISDKDYPQFKDLKWEDEPVEVNLFTNEFMQGFGDACYERGEQDACRFEYGENPEGNLTIKAYVDSKNKTL